MPLVDVVSFIVLGIGQRPIQRKRHAESSARKAECSRATPQQGTATVVVLREISNPMRLLKLFVARFS